MTGGGSINLEAAANKEEEGLVRLVATGTERGHGH